jgi:hypothetical protein
MAIDIPTALYNYFSTDTELISLISTYKAKPAVFTTFHPPEGAELPYITMSPVSEAPAFLSKQKTGEEIVWDINVWTEDVGSVTQIERIKRRIREMIDGNIPIVTDALVVAWDEVGSTAQDEAGVFRRVVSTRLLVSP